MTEQAYDSLQLDGVDYYILEESPGELFWPGRYGLHPATLNTGCQRGFVCRYAVRNGKLEVDRARIWAAGPYPRIGNAPPAVKGVYRDMQLPMQFTGSMRVGSDRHNSGGLSSAFDHHNVIDVEFIDGVLVDQIDRSAEVRARAYDYRAPPQFGGPPSRRLLWLERTRCSLCGTPQRAPRVSACAPWGQAALTLHREGRQRPSQEVAYVQRCSHCAHAAQQIARTPPHLAARLASDDYQSRRFAPDIPEEANRLRAASCLMMAQDRAVDALWLALQAAWCCDDVVRSAPRLGHSAVQAPVTAGGTAWPRTNGTTAAFADHPAAVAAVACRVDALAALRAAWGTNQVTGLRAPTELQLYAELLRREGAFAAALDAIKTAYGYKPALDATRSLRMTERLCEKGDARTPAEAPLTEECVAFVAPWNVAEHEEREAPKRVEAVRQLARQRANTRADVERVERIAAGPASDADRTWYEGTPTRFIENCVQLYLDGKVPDPGNVPVNRDWEWLFLRSAKRNRWPSSQWVLDIALALTRLDPSLAARAEAVRPAWQARCITPELVKYFEHLLFGTTPWRWVVGRNPNISAVPPRYRGSGST